MQSWKQKKSRDEKHKAKRVERQKVAISHISNAKRKHMENIIKGKSSEETKPMVDLRLLEKFKLSIRRSIFR